MNELVFATIIRELKTSWKDSTIADPDLIELLYDAIATPANLVNKSGEVITVSKAAASKIVNRQKGGNPLKIIKDHSTDQIVLKTIDSYFETKVVSRLIPGNEDDLIYRLKTIIENDVTISPEDKNELVALAKKNTFAEFLANAYLFSLKRKNIIDESKEVIEDLESYKRNPLAEIEIPENEQKYEHEYIKAIYEIYGQAEGITEFSNELLASFPKHQKHYNDQRSYYFAAEAVRRGTRDIYSEESQFQILKDETYEGVKEVWEEQYKNGLVRLRKVLTQASNTRVDKCWLSRDTDWIGNPQKKGVCHFLTNEKRLEGWVRDDDEDI